MDDVGEDVFLMLDEKDPHLMSVTAQAKRRRTQATQSRRGPKRGRVAMKKTRSSMK